MLVLVRVLVLVLVRVLVLVLALILTLGQRLVLVWGLKFFLELLQSGWISVLVHLQQMAPQLLLLEVLVPLARQ